MSTEEEHIIEHLRALGAKRARTLVRRLEREQRMSATDIDELFSRLANPTEERQKLWEQIQGDLWEMRVHQRNGDLLDDGDFQGGQVAG